MGLDAQVIAIGKFSQTILPALEYAPGFYAAVPQGTVIAANVFIACTSQDSHELASAFGVGAMELGKHALQSDSADLDKLEELFGSKAIESFRLLAAHGFSFYFLPNA